MPKDDDDSEEDEVGTAGEGIIMDKNPNKP